MDSHNPLAAIGGIAAAGMAIVMAVVFLPLMYFGDAVTGCNPVNDTGPLGDGDPAAFGDWEGFQVSYAAQIIQQGETDNVPAKGWLVAIATVMQESGLKMYANENVPESMDYPHDAVGSDHNSVGLFQQQADQGWGSVRELMDVKISAKRFYAALMDIDGWTTMDLASAAQAVQKSADPDAYADHEKPAEDLIAHITGVDNIDDLIEAPSEVCAPGQPGPQGWLAPVVAPIVSQFRPDDRPDHDGVDLGAERGTPIFAAADGIVMVAECNSSVGCDQDGGEDVTGCGWYVQINHGEEAKEDSRWPGIATMYCHMESKPLVKVGELVLAGQIIGYVGSTGNSSGPHLHYELHKGVNRGGITSSSNAESPIEWHDEVEAPLGEESD